MGSFFLFQRPESLFKKSTDSISDTTSSIQKQCDIDVHEKISAAKSKTEKSQPIVTESTKSTTTQQNLESSVATGPGGQE